MQIIRCTIDYRSKVCAFNDAMRCSFCCQPLNNRILVLCKVSIFLILHCHSFSDRCIQLFKVWFLNLSVLCYLICIDSWISILNSTLHMNVSISICYCIVEKKLEIWWTIYKLIEDRQASISKAVITILLSHSLYAKKSFFAVFSEALINIKCSCTMKLDISLSFLNFSIFIKLLFFCGDCIIAAVNHWCNVINSRCATFMLFSKALVMLL